jgi:hypothetical protein
LSLPAGIAFDSLGNNLDIADSFNNRIRRVSLSSSNVIQTVVNRNETSGAVGDGSAAAQAQLAVPDDVSEG